MSDAMTRTNKVLKDYRKVLDVIAKRLIETETIERQEFDNILVANGITLKQEMKIADEK
jgi:ATP-dependent Zn protease